MPKEVTNEDLATMIKSGFEETATKTELKSVENRLDKVENRLDKLETKVDVIQGKLDNILYL